MCRQHELCCRSARFTARHVAVFTGAGVSAESGIPTFRDAQTGIWAKYNIEELATPGAFRRDPVKVWNWYAQPKPAHQAIARLETLVDRVSVITQNVDGLHRKADSSNIIELHGNIWGTICFDCRQLVAPEQASGVPPRCPHCNGLLRPGVVWFGEAMPNEAWHNAAELSEVADLFFCIGTSSPLRACRAMPGCGDAR